MHKMFNHRFWYETPMGCMFTDIEAKSLEDAEREFWLRHHRDTCYVNRVSVSRRYEERDERADKGRDEPPGTVPEPFFLDMGEARNCGSPYTAIAIVAFTILGFLLGFILARMT